MLIKLWDFQGYECIRTMHGEFLFKMLTAEWLVINFFFLQQLCYRVIILFAFIILRYCFPAVSVIFVCLIYITTVL